MSEEKKDQAIDAASEKTGELSEEALEQVSGGSYSFGASQVGGIKIDFFKVKADGSV